MSRPFVLAHVSDFHVSQFGDTFHDRLRIVRRSAERVVAPAAARVVWSTAGWRVVEWPAGRRTRLSILDPEGYEHPVPSARELRDVLDPVERGAARACRLEARRASTLARALPTDGALDALLQATPHNANARLLRAARALDADAVVATGDLTDDGVGYELIEAAFRRFIDAGRFFAVPGNHDRYLFPIQGSGRPKATHESKAASFGAFAARVGLDVDRTGVWVREIGEASTVLVGLDSCARGQPRFFRQNGAIGPDQMDRLRVIAAGEPWARARHRLVALHHHVVPLPHGIGRRAPSEVGMRLDDAAEVARAFDALGVTAVLHGHRHVSELRQPAGANFQILAAPSLTLGCRSGDAPSYWRIELGERLHAVRVRVPVEPLEDQDDDVSSSDVARLLPEGD